VDCDLKGVGRTTTVSKHLLWVHGMISLGSHFFEPSIDFSVEVSFKIQMPLVVIAQVANNPLQWTHFLAVFLPGLGHSKP
jgi:hypothetical protein